MSHRPALFAATLAAALLVGPAPAGAASRSAPTLQLSFPHSRLTANESFELSISSSHLPNTTSVRLQRAFGKHHVFKTVERLTGTTGSFVAPAVPMGRYLYRLIGVHARHTVAVSTVHTIYAYENLKVSQICDHSHAIHFWSGCADGDIQVGGGLFEFTFDAGQRNTKPGGDPTITAFHSSCRRVTVQYAVSNDQQAKGARHFGASLTQTNAKLESSASTPGNVGTMVFKISSIDWDLEYWSNNKTEVFSDATFSCWSRHGNN